jgi:predicted nucleic acid-binding Zn ribbon protein
VSAWFREASDFEPERSETVGNVLRRWGRRTGLLRVTERDRVWQAWEHLLGRDAAHTSLEGLRSNVATFIVDSSALLSELRSFRKQELLEGLRREVRSYFVRDIRFRLEKRRPAGKE